MKGKRIRLMAAAMGMTMAATTMSPLAASMHAGQWIAAAEGWQYLEDGGKILENTWVQSPDGSWYHFDRNGYMTTGWFEAGPDTWYYLGEDGRMRTGWQTVKNAAGEDKWYYLNQDGKMATGWVEDNGSRYYLNSDGSMATGSAVIDGNEYYFGEAGALTGETGLSDGTASGGVQASGNGGSGSSHSGGHGGNAGSGSESGNAGSGSGNAGGGSESGNAGNGSGSTGNGSESGNTGSGSGDEGQEGSGSGSGENPGEDTGGNNAGDSGSSGSGGSEANPGGDSGDPSGGGEENPGDSGTEEGQQVFNVKKSCVMNIESVDYGVLVFSNGNAGDYELTIGGEPLEFSPVNDEGTIIKFEINPNEEAVVKAVSKKDGNVSQTVKVGTGGQAFTGSLGTQAPAYVLTNGAISSFDYYLPNYDEDGNVRVKPEKSTFSTGDAQIPGGGEEDESRIPKLSSERTRVGEDVRITFEATEEAKKWQDSIYQIKKDFGGSAGSREDLAYSMEEGAIVLDGDQRLLDGQNGKHDVVISAHGYEDARITVETVRPAGKLMLDPDFKFISGNDLLFEMEDFNYGITNPVYAVYLDGELLEGDCRDYHVVSSLIRLENECHEKLTAGDHTLVVKAEGYEDYTASFTLREPMPNEENPVWDGSAESLEAADESPVKNGGNEKAEPQDGKISGSSSEAAQAKRIEKTVTVKSDNSRKAGKKPVKLDAIATASVSGGSGSGGSGGDTPMTNAYLVFEFDLVANAEILRYMDMPTDESEEVLSWWSAVHKEALFMKDGSDRLIQYGYMTNYCGKAYGDDSYLTFKDLYENPMEGAEYADRPYSVKHVLEDGLLGDIVYWQDGVAGIAAPVLTVPEVVNEGEDIVIGYETTEENKDWADCIDMAVAQGYAPIDRENYAIDKEKQTITIKAEAPLGNGDNTITFYAKNYENAVAKVRIEKKNESQFELALSEDGDLLVSGLSDSYAEKFQGANLNNHALFSDEQVSTAGSGEGDYELNGNVLKVRKKALDAYAGGEEQNNTLVLFADGFADETLSFKLKELGQSENEGAQVPELVELSGGNTYEAGADVAIKTDNQLIGETGYGRKITSVTVNGTKVENKNTGWNAYAEFVIDGENFKEEGTYTIVIHADGYRDKTFEVEIGSSQAGETAEAPAVEKVEFVSGILSDDYYRVSFKADEDTLGKYLNAENLSVEVNGVKYRETSMSFWGDENAFKVSDDEYEGYEKYIDMTADGFREGENTVVITADGYSEIELSVTVDAEGNVTDTPAEGTFVPEFDHAQYVSDEIFGTKYYRLSFAGMEEEALEAYLENEALQVEVNGKAYERDNMFWQPEYAFRASNDDIYGGADIYLDLTADGFKAGENTVVLTADGYGELEITFSVNGDGTVSDGEEERKAAPEVDGAEYADGIFGDYYRVSFKGVEEDELEAYLNAGTLSVAVNGETYERTGTFFFDSMAFTISDNSYGTAAYLDLTADGFETGENTVAVKADGYEDLEFTVTIDEDGNVTEDEEEGEGVKAAPEADSVEHKAEETSNYYRVSFRGMEEEELEAYLNADTLSVTVNGNEYERTGFFFFDFMAFTVSDDPYGTAAYLDLTADGFETGENTVAVKADGYEDLEFTITIDEDGNVTEDEELLEVPETVGIYDILGEGGFDDRYDAITIESGGIVQIAAGDIIDYRPYREALRKVTVKLDGDTVEELSAGEIDWRDEGILDFPYLFVLDCFDEPGEYTVELQADGYEDKTLEVTVEEEEELSEEVILEEDLSEEVPETGLEEVPSWEAPADPDGSLSDIVEVPGSAEDEGSKEEAQGGEKKPEAGENGSEEDAGEAEEEPGETGEDTEASEEEPGETGEDAEASEEKPGEDGEDTDSADGNTGLPEEEDGSGDSSEAETVPSEPSDPSGAPSGEADSSGSQEEEDGNSQNDGDSDGGYEGEDESSSSDGTDGSGEDSGKDSSRDEGEGDLTEGR